MKKNKLSMFGVLLVTVLPLLVGSMAGCAPKLTRDMLTPSPTVTETPLPTRTPDPSKPTRTPRPTDTPDASGRPSTTPADVVGQPTRAVRLSTIPLLGLKVEEYYLGPAEDYDLQPGSIEKNQEFYDNIPQEVFARRAVFQAEQAISSPDEINTALEPFGFRMEPTGGQSSRQYRIYRGEELLFDHVTAYGAVSLNRSGTDFIFPITLGNYEVWVIQKDRFEMWYAGEPRHLPIFAGDDVVAIGEPEEYKEAGQMVFGVPILVNNEPKFRLALPYQGANNCPIEKFRAWGDRWVLEMEGEVLVDGEKLTKKYAYEQVFNWQLINGKPFFLFKDAGYYGMLYDGEKMSVTYSEIVHWSCIDQQGGGGINLSVVSSDQMVAFFARRGMGWYYVQVGDFK